MGGVKKFDSLVFYDIILNKTYVATILGEGENV